MAKSPSKRSKPASKTATRSTRSNAVPAKVAKGKTAKSGASAQAKTKTPKVITPEAPVTRTAIEGPGEQLKKKELIDMIVEQTGVKKKFAKPVIEAMLETLGHQLEHGRDMQLPPMGKLTVKQVKMPNEKVVIECKLRRNMPTGSVATKPSEKPAASPLAGSSVGS